MRIHITLALLIFMGMVPAVLAGEDAKAMALSDTPPAVQSTITNQVADGALGDIDRTNEDGETTYEVTFTPKGGEERDFSVAEDGSLLSVEMLLPEVPAAVRKTIEMEANSWELENIDKNVDETEPSYDVDASKSVDGAGQSRHFSVAENGGLLSLSLVLTNTPAAVQAAIQTQAGGGTVESLDETFDADGNQFDVEVVKGDGAKRSFTLTEDGRIFSEEVSLEQVPPGARKTINEKVGNGKLLLIERALLEKKDGVLPYYVESRKDGKEFNFSVGPKGRFLGMDE
jgi:uncharacterized membrane protein YkoI